MSDIPGEYLFAGVFGRDEGEPNEPHAIQRINKGIFGSATQSSVDGRYGSLTQADVRAFQDLKGLWDDALVGPLTWGAYDNHLTSAQCWPTGECYWWIWQYEPVDAAFRQFSSFNPWESQRLGWFGWVQFTKFGPA